MRKLATAADYRGETSTGRPSRRPISSVARTGAAALCLAVLIGIAGVAYAQDVVITTTGDRLVETFDGRRLSGALKPDPEKKPVVQIAETSVQLQDVSAVQPFERTFWSRFDTALDFGNSMTRANSAKQFSLGANLSYRDERYVDVVLANVFRSSQENAPETQRWDLGMTSAACWATGGTSTPPRTS